MGSRRQNIQLVASLLVAALLVAVTIAVVTAEFGSTPAAELELREERLQQREELREERRELREERLEGREGAIRLLPLSAPHRGRDS